MINKEFFQNKAVIGMVHLLPLPGSPNYDGDNQAIEKRAIEDAIKLEKGGVDAFIVENFGDEPYDTSISLEAYSLMLSIAQKIKEQVKIPFGINVQFNCYEEEWAMAYALDADFIRVETFVETRYGSYGVSGPCAAKLLRKRKEYPAKTMFFADINGKHTYGISGISVFDAAHDAKANGANAIIITGKYTGQNPSIDDIKELREYVGDFPILVGSGGNYDNVNDFLKYADGIIIGSSFKVDGNVYNGIDFERVDALVKKVRKEF